MRRIIVLFLLLYVAKVHAQRSSDGFDLTSPANVYAPSKSAAQLVRLTDIPVTFYTGAPQISYPLYNIKCGDLNYPISLSYTSTGVPVEEEANWVGLGWDLSLGAAIVRSVAGKADDLTNGYLSAATYFGMPLYTDINPSSWLNTLTTCNKRDIAQNLYDLSPDIYYLNFNGQSAKMFFDRNGNAMISPFKPWKITGNQSSGFTVIIENGTKYEFNTIETIINDVNSSPDDGGSAFTCKSAWHLSRMVSANKADTIQFNYSPIAYNEDAKVVDETRFDLVPGQNTNPCGNGLADLQKLTFSYTNKTVSSFLLTSITYRGGKIEPTLAADRQDIGTDAGNPYRITELNCYSLNAGTYTLFKKIKFNQTYSNTSSTNVMSKRLLLSSYTEIGGATDSLVYTFSYNNPDQLPNKNSYSQDHWGYNNGRFNSALVPAYDDGAGTTYSGANREPDSSAAKIGLLQSITYPTGGIVNLDYELHDYSYYNSSSVYTPRHNDSVVVDNGISATTVRLHTAAGQDTAILFLKPGVTGQDVGVSYMVNGKIYGDALAEVYIKDENFNTLFSGGDTHGASLPVVIAFQTGKKYYFIASRDQSTERAIIGATYKDWNYIVVPPVYKEPAGGCRIKRITLFDGINHQNDIVKRFVYQENDSISSGVLLDYPRYADITYTPYYCGTGIGGAPEKSGDWSYMTRHAGSLIALGRTQGSTIGYSKVTVLNGENGENGKEEFYYTLKNTSDQGGNGYPYIPKSSLDDLRGLLLQHKVYTSNGSLLHATVNEYANNNLTGSPNFKFVFGARYGIRRQSNTVINNCPDGTDWSFIGGMYKIYQLWPVLKSTTDSSFNLTDGGSLVAKVNYQYDSSNVQVSREDRIDSDGSQVSTVYKYPNSYTGTAVYDSMLSRNMLSSLIEKIVTRNSVQIYREKNNFGFFNAFIAPLSKEAIHGNIATETRLQFYRYDAKGNLLEQSKTSDTHEVYVWGYNNQYPVAKVTGSNYDTVIALVNQNILQNPTSDQQLRDELNKIRTGLGSSAQVITYTYLREVGISSETNAIGNTEYYEYDNMERLKLIRDKDGMIIKQFDYQYQQPISQ